MIHALSAQTERDVEKQSLQKATDSSQKFGLRFWLSCFSPGLEKVWMNLCGVSINSFFPDRIVFLGLNNMFDFTKLNSYNSDRNYMKIMETSMYTLTQFELSSSECCCRMANINSRTKRSVLSRYTLRHVIKENEIPIT